MNTTSATQKNAPRTARVALTEHENSVQSLLTQLAAQLAEKKAHSATHSVDWGHVGDLTEVETRLAEIVAFLGGGK